MRLKTDMPQIGEKIKAGDPLMGAICIIQKIQQVNSIDGKWMLMPQNLPFNPDEIKKDGYDEILTIPITKEGETEIKETCILWCNYEEQFNVEQELEKVYNAPKGSEQIKEVMGIDFIGRQYDKIGEFLNKLDFNKLHCGSAIYSAGLSYMRNYKNLQGLIDRDKFEKKIMIRYNEMPECEAISKIFLEKLTKIKENNA